MTAFPCEFSDDRAYRYSWRCVFAPVLPGRRAVLFLMLNPSTADETQMDPTLRRCAAFARGWGYDGFEVANLYALRSTDPGALVSHPAPISERSDPTRNDRAIIDAARRCERVVVAWGASLPDTSRSQHVLVALQTARVEPVCLGTTQHGHPRHPLYVPGRAEVRGYHSPPSTGSLRSYPRPAGSTYPSTPAPGAPSISTPTRR